MYKCVVVIDRYKVPDLQYAVYLYVILLLLFQLADSHGPDICILKTHIDIVSDFTAEVSVKLKELARKHNFIIMEDR